MNNVVGRQCPLSKDECKPLFNQARINPNGRLFVGVCKQKGAPEGGPFILKLWLPTENSHR